jgi:hypothetical protein
MEIIPVLQVTDFLGKEEMFHLVGMELAKFPFPHILLFGSEVILRIADQFLDRLADDGSVRTGLETVIQFIENADQLFVVTVKLPIVYRITVPPGELFHDLPLLVDLTPLSQSGEVVHNF